MAAVVVAALGWAGWMGWVAETVPRGKALDVGFNPFRPRRRSAADYLMVASALVICAALVLWALLG